MQKNLLILFVIIIQLVGAKYSNAITASPFPFEISQPDGTKLMVVLHGDEFFHWSSTIDGYTIIRNESGVFEYAIQDADQNLTLSGVKARNTEARLASEQEFIRGLQHNLPFSSFQIQKALDKNPINRSNTKRGGFPSTGENKLLMILANFADTDTTYTQQNFDDYMNKPGGYTGKGSFKDYYQEVSYGQLTVQTVVTVWITLPKNHDYYAERSPELVYTAVLEAD